MSCAWADGLEVGSHGAAERLFWRDGGVEKLSAPLIEEGGVLPLNPGSGMLSRRGGVLAAAGRSTCRVRRQGGGGARRMRSWTMWDLTCHAAHHRIWLCCHPLGHPVPLHLSPLKIRLAFAACRRTIAGRTRQDVSKVSAPTVHSTGSGKAVPPFLFWEQRVIN